MSTGYLGMGQAFLRIEIPGFEVDEVVEYETRVVVRAHSVTGEGQCPDCQQVSKRIHSYYTRSVWDMPSAGRAVQLVLGVGRYRCLNPVCRRVTFVERVPELVAVHGQRTQRLNQMMQGMALQVGGEVGTRLLRHLQISTSADTLLRLVRRWEAEPSPVAEIVGIDDWAFKKRKTYGTIVVDLARHCVIDLLPDRTSASLADWLQGHPNVQTLCRDRAGAYAEGARLGAPDVLQVADRWHLLHNLWDALVLTYNRHQALLHQITFEEVTSAQPIAVLMPSPMKDKAEKPNPTRLSPAEQIRAQRWAYWQAKLEAVHELRDQGHSLHAIARQLGLNIQTVRKYARLAVLPQRTQTRRHPRPSMVDPYRTYLSQRLLNGGGTSRQLWRELQAQGFRGGHTIVYRYLLHLRQTLGLPVSDVQAKPPLARLTAQGLATLVLRRPQDCFPQQIQLIDQASQIHPDILQATQLATSFAALLRQHQSTLLPSWLQQAESSALRYLITFAAGLRRDYAAVQAAIALPWSNGQTEGQINRLKLIKRQMYGRANFDLLRLRVMFHDP